MIIEERINKYLLNEEKKYSENKYETDFSPKLKNLIQNALSKGFEFEWGADNKNNRTSFNLYKKNNKIKKITKGVEVFFSKKGTFLNAIRKDIDLTIATKLKTIKEVKKALEI